MLSFGALGFASPWLLSALIGLPAIWWLLRSVPPLPKRVRFPAIGLLAALQSEDEQPARTPIWLVALRMLLAALVILALAEPLLNPPPRAGTALPLLIAVDDGWASAADWSDRRQVLGALADEAARADEPVALLTTAARANAEPPIFKGAGETRAVIDGLMPMAWAPDRAAAALRLRHADLPAHKFRVVWLADGVDGAGTAELEAALKARGALEIVGPARTRGALLLHDARIVPEGLAVRVSRADTTAARGGTLRAHAADGQGLADTPFTLAAGTATTEVTFTLARLVLNDAARIDVLGEHSAGATLLLDEASRRRGVGLVSGDSQGGSQPLLSDVHYLQRALQPFADVATGTLENVLGQNQSLIVLADVGRIVGSAHDDLTRWIEAGGTLVRFAGPRMAENVDDLVPVPLRQGGRTLGGALSWASPQSLAPFDETSPFAGLAPTPEVKVSRQVLAEPAPDLAQKTWARLTDGTPLVTAAPRGKGLLVLFHITANTAWSDLPISGLYVEMLQRLLTLSHSPRAPGDAAPGPGTGRVSSVATPLQPLAILDAFGALGAQTSEALALPASNWRSLSVSPSHPPGLYGPPTHPVAFNVGRPDMVLAPLHIASTRTLDGALDTRTRSLKPHLLTAAALLALFDVLTVLIVSGAWAMLVQRFGKLRLARRGALILALGLLGLMAPQSARAQSHNAESFAMEAALDFHLAYVKTGNASVDALCEAGLSGLGRTLAARTAVEPASPMAVDLEADELAFFPLLYWQVSTAQPDLSEAALSRLDAYLKRGGTLLIDTADADQSFGGDEMGGPGALRLRRILTRLDLPPLEPVPPDHVLTKSFYLMRSFPGRYANGRVWVEKSENGSDHDGVATLIVGSNDWASAWARDDDGRPLAPLEPGGEDQREWAMRFGVNLVMYALTGNYKADQVHVPALLERLGQ